MQQFTSDSRQRLSNISFFFFLPVTYMYRKFYTTEYPVLSNLKSFKEVLLKCFIYFSDKAHFIRYKTYFRIARIQWNICRYIFLGGVKLPVFTSVYILGYYKSTSEIIFNRIVG